MLKHRTVAISLQSEVSRLLCFMPLDIDKLLQKFTIEPWILQTLSVMCQNTDSVKQRTPYVHDAINPCYLSPTNNEVFADHEVNTTYCFR